MQKNEARLKDVLRNYQFKNLPNGKISLPYRDQSTESP